MSVELLFAELLQRPILLGLLILFSILLLVSWIARQPPGKPQLYLLQGGIIIAFVALMALVVTQHLPWLFAVVGGLLPVAVRVVQLLEGQSTARRIRSRQRRSSSSSTNSGSRAQTSTSGSRRGSKVNTRFLRMYLDKDTGHMRGKVLKGTFVGKHLSELTSAQLRQLHEQYSQQDAESAALLGAYLDQINGATQEAPHAGADKTEQDAGAEETHSRAKGNGMTRAEAYEILGLKNGADHQAVTSAHRRLMQKIHPDRGGTNYLAAKINQAKDLLLDT